MAQAKAPPVSNPAFEALIAQGLGVGGSTFQVKDGLFRLGCRWYPFRRVWVAPNALVLQRAQDLVNQGPSAAEVDDFGLNRVPTAAMVSELRFRNIDLDRSTLADAVAGWPPTLEEYLEGFEDAFDFSEFDGRPSGGKGDP